MASMTEKDYYAILGVSEQATTDEIRKAFQQKARTLHPDVNKEPDAEERFKEVSEAYAVLSDEGKRRRYDAMRSGSPFAGYSDPYAGASYGGTTYNSGDPFAGTPFDWGFPFGTTSRRTARSRAYRPRAGANIEYDLVLDDQVAEKGCRRGVTYQHYVTCTHCNGMGSVASRMAEKCPTCGGAGHITIDLSGIFGIGYMDVECPECEGSGRVVANPCEVCGGTGRVLSADELVVEVPADSHDGDEIVISGAGNAGTNGKSTGDFICRVGVPSEQVGILQARGFHTLGFAAPFIVFGLFTHVYVWCVILLAMGTWMVFSGGSLLGHTRRWWRNASSSFLAGCTSGVKVALFTAALYLLFGLW